MVWRERRPRSWLKQSTAFRSSQLSLLFQKRVVFCCVFFKRKFLFLCFLFQVVTAAASNLLFDENGKPRTLGPNFAGNPAAAKPILAAAPVPKQIKVLPEV